jgi:hypothetical protein
MGLLQSIFGITPARGVVFGDDEFEFHVVGTLHHQTELEAICGGHHRTSAHQYCAALLVPEFNVHDRHAIAVVIRGKQVGHLGREDAHEFREALHRDRFADAACEAMIVGGWDRGGKNKGFFGVRLNACLPFRERLATSRFSAWVIIAPVSINSSEPLRGNDEWQFQINAGRIHRVEPSDYLSSLA